MEGKLPRGTVMHPDLSFDARRVAFAFCDHSPSDPNWRQFSLWQVDVEGIHLHRLTGTPSDRTAGAEGRETALVEADPAGTFFHTPSYLKLYWEEFGDALELDLAQIGQGDEVPVHEREDVVVVLDQELAPDPFRMLVHEAEDAVVVAALGLAGLELGAEGNAVFPQPLDFALGPVRGAHAHPGEQAIIEIGVFKRGRKISDAGFERVEIIP